MSVFTSLFGASPTPTTPTTPAQTTQPTQTQVTQQSDVSPLDSFKSLWEPTPSDGNVDNTLPGNMFAGADPAKMLEAARKVDFAKSINPEIMSKISAGGPEAATAFAQAINEVSQRAYAQSSFASTKIVEAALAKFQEGLDNRLPSQIKKHQVSNSIRESNPALQHPAAAPIMEALQAQFTVKFPNATVNEIRDMASEYLTQFATAALPKPKGVQVAASEDWDKFFAS
jgi:hypothetical protein